MAKNIAIVYLAIACEISEPDNCAGLHNLTEWLTNLPEEASGMDHGILGMTMSTSPLDEDDGIELYERHLHS